MIVSWAADPRPPGPTIVRLRAAESCLPLVEHPPRCRCKLRRVSPQPIRKGRGALVAPWTRWRRLCQRDRPEQRRPTDKRLATALRRHTPCRLPLFTPGRQAILAAVRLGRLHRPPVGTAIHPLRKVASPPASPSAGPWRRFRWAGPWHQFLRQPHRCRAKGGASLPRFAAAPEIRIWSSWLPVSAWACCCWQVRLSRSF